VAGGRRKIGLFPRWLDAVYSINVWAAQGTKPHAIDCSDMFLRRRDCILREVGDPESAA
jgi:hypothetical protein